MNNPLTAIGPIIALALLYVLFPIVADTYRRFRGGRIVTCPQTQKPTEVELDAAHEALTAIKGQPLLEVTRCSRWPEDEHCGQECVEQIAVGKDQRVAV